MKRKKRMYIKNNIVFDPNIESPSFLDYDYNVNKINRKKYLRGKGKRIVYRGI